MLNKFSAQSCEKKVWETFWKCYDSLKLTFVRVSLFYLPAIIFVSQEIFCLPANKSPDVKLVHTRYLRKDDHVHLVRTSFASIFLLSSFMICSVLLVVIVDTCAFAAHKFHHYFYDCRLLTFVHRGGHSWRSWVLAIRFCSSSMRSMKEGMEFSNTESQVLKKSALWEWCLRILTWHHIFIYVGALESSYEQFLKSIC